MDDLQANRNELKATIAEWLNGFISKHVKKTIIIMQ